MPTPSSSQKPFPTLPPDLLFPVARFFDLEELLLLPLSTEVTLKDSESQQIWESLVIQNFPDDHATILSFARNNDPPLLVSETLWDLEYRRAYNRHYGAYTAPSLLDAHCNALTRRTTILFRHVKQGNVDALKNLNLSLHDLAEHRDAEMHSLGYWAHRNKRTHVLDYFEELAVKTCGTPFGKKHEDKNLLHWAVICFLREDHLQYILHLGYRIDYIDSRNRTAFHYAALYDNVPAATFLYKRNETLINLFSDDAFSNGSPLSLACRKGYIESAHFLLTRETIQLMNEDGENALASALDIGAFELASHLFEHPSIHSEPYREHLEIQRIFHKEKSALLKELVKHPEPEIKIAVDLILRGAGSYKALHDKKNDRDDLLKAIQINTAILKQTKELLLSYSYEKEKHYLHFQNKSRLTRNLHFISAIFVLTGIADALALPFSLSSSSYLFTFLIEYLIAAFCLGCSSFLFSSLLNYSPSSTHNHLIPQSSLENFIKQLKRVEQRKQLAIENKTEAPARTEKIKTQRSTREPFCLFGRPAPLTMISAEEEKLIPNNLEIIPRFS